MSASRRGRAREARAPGAAGPRRDRRRRREAAGRARGVEARRAKPDPRDRLRRVLFLVPYAVRHPGIPVKDLARQCGCTEKELLEDLDFLLGVGSPPFAPDDFLDLYVEGDRVYVALHQSLSRPPRFTESEAAALAAAARALGGEGRERAVKALRDAVPRDRRASFDELVGRIYAGRAARRATRCSGGSSAPSPSGARCGSRYHSASREEDSERVVHPFTLAQRFGHWYLYGHDPARGKALPFRLDRIRECAVTDERFEPPLGGGARAARGSSRRPQGEAIRIRLGPLAAAWALARPGIRLVARDRGRRRGGRGPRRERGVGDPLRPVARRRRRGRRAGRRPGATSRTSCERALSRYA